MTSAWLLTNRILIAYVKKTGDTMSGIRLMVSPSIASLGGTKPGNMLIVNSKLQEALLASRKTAKIL